MRLNLLPMFGVLAAILVPFTVLLALSGPIDPFVFVAFLPILLIVAILLPATVKLARAPPTVTTVTNRRILVENPAKDGASSTFTLENLGDVEVSQAGYATRRAGVAWVYLLPTGATRAIVGRGRARRAAPGVVWIPAMPLAAANALRDVAVAQARALQGQLGYATLAGDIPGR